MLAKLIAFITFTDQSTKFAVINVGLMFSRRVSTSKMDKVLLSKVLESTDFCVPWQMPCRQYCRIQIDIIIVLHDSLLNAELPVSHGTTVSEYGNHVMTSLGVLD